MGALASCSVYYVVVVVACVALDVYVAYVKGHCINYCLAALDQVVYVGNIASPALRQPADTELGVSVYGSCGSELELLERVENGQELHLVVGCVLERSANKFCAYEGSPPTRARVARAGSIGIYHCFHTMIIPYN